MRYAFRALLAGGLGFAVSFLVACGGGVGLLSGGHAATLNAQLDHLSSAVDAGQCGAASHAAASLGTAVEQLPRSVNRTLRNNLTQGAQTVAQLAEQDCTQVSTPAHTTSTQTQTTTTATITTPTNTNTTPTQPPVNTGTGSGTNTQPPATTGGGPGTTSTGSSGGAGVGGGSTGGAGSSDGGNGNGQ